MRFIKSAKATSLQNCENKMSRHLILIQVFLTKISVFTLIFNLKNGMSYFNLKRFTNNQLNLFDLSSKINHQKYEKAM